MMMVFWLLQRLPLVWTGQLVLKNDIAAVRMHYVSGNQDLVRASLPPEALTQDGSGTTLSQLRISQRMRLDPSQLDQVSKRMEVRLICRVVPVCVWHYEGTGLHSEVALGRCTGEFRSWVQFPVMTLPGYF